MELAFLPKERIKKKTYRHFTITATVGIPAAELSSFEFFYIGKNSLSIDNLVKAFENGYVAESLENATYILKRLIEKSNAVPDIIIVDASFALKELHDFYQFFIYQQSLSNIPFLLDASNTSKTEVDKFRNAHFIDEIIFVQSYNKQELVDKTNFVRKIKRSYPARAKSIETSAENLCGARCMIKRTFDILISTGLLVFLSPFLFLIAVIIKLESPGPVFYISKRAGRGYRIFDFYKFRTMSARADEMIESFSHLNLYSGNSTVTPGPVFYKINNDPRITKIGLVLRKLSLDELPQLLNVLKGDMSLVGNRPLPLYEASTLTTGQWAKRFMAPAGITGLWQIKKRGKEDMSAEERISLDIDYADRYNFIYDLWIMANTPSALIQKTNA